MLIDSHCHLNYASLGEDVPGVLARARSAGVGASSPFPAGKASGTA